MNQLVFDLANLAADRADRAIESWTDRALDAFKAYAIEHREFTTEDVVLANPSLPAPPDKRAWGAVTMKAQRQGIVTSTDKLARAKSPHAHKRPLLVLASNVFCPVGF